MVEEGDADGGRCAALHWCHLCILPLEAAAGAVYPGGELESLVHACMRNKRSFAGTMPASSLLVVLLFCSTNQPTHPCTVNFHLSFLFTLHLSFLFTLLVPTFSPPSQMRTALRLDASPRLQRASQAVAKPDFTKKDGLGNVEEAMIQKYGGGDDEDSEEEYTDDDE
jgi:hypothetical protein